MKSSKNAVKIPDAVSIAKADGEREGAEKARAEAEHQFITMMARKIHGIDLPDETILCTSVLKGTNVLHVMFAVGELKQYARTVGLQLLRAKI